jgi:hypothetical protein
LPHLVIADRLIELHHQDRAAREVDAERNALLDAVDQAGDDDDRRQADGVPAPLMKS